MGTITQNLQKLIDAKNDIAEAITDKGGTVSQGDGFEDFPAEILGIPVATFEACELIKPSGFGGEVYGINTEDRTIVAGLLYNTTGSYSSSIVLTFPQGFTPRYTVAPYGTYGVYYDYGYGSPRTFDPVTITNSSITLEIRGNDKSNQTKQIPFCIQFGAN